MDDIDSIGIGGWLAITLVVMLLVLFSAWIVSEMVDYLHKDEISADSIYAEIDEPIFHIDTDW